MVLLVPCAWDGAGEEGAVVAQGPVLVEIRALEVVQEGREVEGRPLVVEEVARAVGRRRLVEGELRAIGSFRNRTEHWLTLMQRPPGVMTSREGSGLRTEADLLGREQMFSKEKTMGPVTHTRTILLSTPPATGESFITETNREGL